MKSFLALSILLATAVSFSAVDEPEFDFAYSDGLYATVSLPKTIGKPVFERGESVELLGIPGFRREVEVHAIWQTDGRNRIVRAPLAVPLLGIAGRNNDYLARLWQQLLYETGSHVMSANSSLSYDFNKASGHGVPGNLEADAQAIAKVIEAFLNRPEARDKVTEVRLLGSSYGGNVALYLARLSKEGKLNFPLGAVVVLSPTVSLHTTARILDDFYGQDFATYNYNPAKLAPLVRTPLVSPQVQVPFKPRMMRAGIGYVFHSELPRIVKKSDEMYHLGLLEKYERADDKRGEPRSWTFTQFVENMSFPYWQRKGAVQSVDAFWSMGELKKLLPTAGENVFVYLSKDDPLNDPADVAALQAHFNPPLFNVLPGGGHLGYAKSQWTKKIVMNRFACGQLNCATTATVRP